MKKQSYEGRAIGLGALDAETMDTLRLSYRLAQSAKPSVRKFGGYRAIALVSPHLNFQQSIVLLTKAYKIVKAKSGKENAIVFPFRGKPRALHLNVNLDWRVEHYYNDADWLEVDVKLSTPDCDMILLFSSKLADSKRLAAVRLMRSRVREYGLPKGIVALGGDSMATVYGDARLLYGLDVGAFR